MQKKSLITHQENSKGACNRNQAFHVRNIASHWVTFPGFLWPNKDKQVRETAAQHVLTAMFRLGLDREAGCSPPNCTQDWWFGSTLNAWWNRLGAFHLSRSRSCFRTKRKPPPGDYVMKILPFVPLRPGFLRSRLFCGSWTCGDAFFARSSVVLLKNTGVLPLTKGKVHRSLGGKKSSKLSVICGLWYLTWSRRIAVLGEAAVDEAHNSFIGKGCNDPTLENFIVFVVLFRCIGGSQQAMMLFMYWYTMYFWMNLVDFLHFLKHVSPVLDSMLQCFACLWLRHRFRLCSAWLISEDSLGSHWGRVSHCDGDPQTISIDIPRMFEKRRAGSCPIKFLNRFQ